MDRKVLLRFSYLAPFGVVSVPHRLFFTFSLRGGKKFLGFRRYGIEESLISIPILGKKTSYFDLADLLELCVTRVIYLNSDLVVVDDIVKLWKTGLGPRIIGSLEYCHANFTKYSPDERLSGILGRNACYFNIGVMVIDLKKWRRASYTKRTEKWMEIQKTERIYELRSLPPLLLVFAGHVAPISRRWNQHGLGGDTVKGRCRDLHPGLVSLLHWSGSGKLRLDSNQPCPVDALRN